MLHQSHGRVLDLSLDGLGVVGQAAIGRTGVTVQSAGDASTDQMLAVLAGPERYPDRQSSSGPVVQCAGDNGGIDGHHDHFASDALCYEFEQHFDTAGSWKSQVTHRPLGPVLLRLRQRPAPEDLHTLPTF